MSSRRPSLRGKRFETHQRVFDVALTHLPYRGGWHQPNRHSKSWNKLAETAGNMWRRGSKTKPHHNERLRRSRAEDKNEIWKIFLLLLLITWFANVFSVKYGGYIISRKIILNIIFSSSVLQYVQSCCKSVYLLDMQREDSIRRGLSAIHVSCCKEAV